MESLAHKEPESMGVNEIRVRIRCILREAIFEEAVCSYSALALLLVCYFCVCILFGGGGKSTLSELFLQWKDNRYQADQ